MTGQKNIAGLFSKSSMMRTSEEEQQMASFLESNWLRPLRRPLPVLEVVKKLEYLEFVDHQIILSENEKIEHYYFLLEGAAICERHREYSEQSQQRQFVREVIGPKQLGEGLYSPGLLRSASYQAHGLVKCCRVEYQVLRHLCCDALQDNQDFEIALAGYLGTSLQAISKLELGRFLTYREFNIRDRLIQCGERRSSKNVVYFVLNGECRMSIQTVSEDSIGRYNSVVKYQELPLVHICRSDLIGAEILLEQQYRYNYTVTTEPICVLEINCSNIEQFPRELRERLMKTYQAQQKMVRMLVEQQPSKFDRKQLTIRAGTSLRRCATFNRMLHEINKTQAKELKQLCMFVPNHHRQHSSDREANLTVPYSGFIPKKKQSQKPVVYMNRRLWSNYLKLPSLRDKPSINQLCTASLR